MSGLKIDFNVSQTDWCKAGRGFYTEAFLDSLLAEDVRNKFTSLNHHR